MPLYIAITANGDPKALLEILKYAVEMDEDDKWYINDKGDFQRQLETGDARTAQAFHPVIEKNQLKLVFENDGTYEPSDYAEYYGYFVQVLIKNYRNHWSMFRIQFDDKTELEVERPSTEDRLLNPLPVREIKAILDNKSLDAAERVKQVSELIKKFGW
jgi:hypothetical protein